MARTKGSKNKRLHKKRWTESEWNELKQKVAEQDKASCVNSMVS